MSLKQDNQTLKEFYVECMKNDREYRKLIAEEYDIPSTKANKAFYQGQGLVLKELANVEKGGL